MRGANTPPLTTLTLGTSMIDPFEDAQAARQLEQDGFLDALNEFDVSALTDEQLRRLADIVDGLRLHIEQEFMERDDPPEDD